MKPKQLKPLRLWAWPAHLAEGRVVLCDHRRSPRSNRRIFRRALPAPMVRVIVFTVDEHRELVARIARQMWSNVIDRRDGRETVRAVLTAAGIVPVKRKARR